MNPASPASKPRTREPLPPPKRRSRSHGVGSRRRPASRRDPAVELADGESLQSDTEYDSIRDEDGEEEEYDDGQEDDDGEEDEEEEEYGGGSETGRSGTSTGSRGSRPSVASQSGKPQRLETVLEGLSIAIGSVNSRRDLLEKNRRDEGSEAAADGKPRCNVCRGPCRSPELHGFGKPQVRRPAGTGNYSRQDPYGFSDDQESEADWIDP